MAAQRRAFVAHVTGDPQRPAPGEAVISAAVACARSAWKSRQATLAPGAREAPADRAADAAAPARDDRHATIEPEDLLVRGRRVDWL
jgi:hypothetical protein